MLTIIVRFPTTRDQTGAGIAALEPSRAFFGQAGRGENIFRKYYLTPLSAPIWSTPVDKIMDFPAYSW